VVDDSKPVATDPVNSANLAVSDVERKRRDLEELAACKSDMIQSVSRHIDWLLQQYNEVYGQPLSIAEASKRARVPFPLDYEAEDFDPEHVTWHELSSLADHDDERLPAIWQHVKASARTEWETGARAAKSIERPAESNPYERARFFVLLDAFRDALKPRDALEDVLIQQMATAYDMHLRWQAKAVLRIEEEVWEGERDIKRMLDQMSKREREQHEQFHGWLPPRQHSAEATEQAALIADRYQRSFLRLLKAFRDNRRMFASLVVAGGQVNITDGPQQVNN
jgi:hypothetical protein